MPRPKKCRRISKVPERQLYKPQGIPLRHLEEVYLPLDSFEAFRLADYEKKSTEEAAREMGVSRHTFGRLLKEARHVVARALVTGSALCILYENEAGHLQIEETGVVKTDGEKDMTILAISSEGPQMTDMVDPRFGRAAGFVLFNQDTGETTYLENGAAQSMAHGAGIQTAETIVKAGATVVLSGRIGPKAMAVLKNAGIKILENMEGKSVAEAIEQYNSGS